MQNIVNSLDGTKSDKNIALVLLVLLSLALICFSLLNFYVGIYILNVVSAKAASLFIGIISLYLAYKIPSYLWKKIEGGGVN